jgi:hypothetical protein
MSVVNKLKVANLCLALMCSASVFADPDKSEKQSGLKKARSPSILIQDWLRCLTLKTSPQFYESGHEVKK